VSTTIKKPLISEEEWVRFNIRENRRVPREKMPHCFGMPILTLPECNGKPGVDENGQPFSPNLCQIRQSCALAYAERLKLDISKAYGSSKDAQYPALVAMIKAEEARIQYVPEIGRKATERAAQKIMNTGVTDYNLDSGPVGVSEEKEVSMEEAVRSKEVAATDAPVSIKVTILASLSSNEWRTKAQISALVEDKLNRHPLNPAVVHKISVVLLPKTQVKEGYTIHKEIRDRIHYYRFGGYVAPN